MKALSLISGGIDSPVSTYLMMKRMDVSVVHFYNYPFTDLRQLNKSKRLTKQLAGLLKRKIKFYTVMHGNNQEEFLKKCDRRYACTLCRRMMFRIAEKIAEKEKCKYLITGENLGQVCSQTLTNLTTAMGCVKIEILRPLLCYDKVETINLAKKIKTYDISIEPSICCKAVPNHPKTNVSIEEIENQEANLDINSMINESLKTLKAEIIK